MNEASLRYTAYKSLLEGRITQDQYDFITEAGVMSMLGSGVKNLFGALKKGASTVKDTYNQDQFQDVKDAAEVAIKKLVKQLRTVGAKLEKSDEDVAGAIAAVLSGALQEAGIDPKALLAVDKAIPGMTAAGEGESSGTSSGGTVVTTDTITSNPSVAAALSAAATGGSAADAAAEAEKSKKNARDLVKDWVDGIVQGTGVEEKKTKKIVNTLLDAGRIKIDLSSLKESLRRFKKTLTERRMVYSRRDPILERWQRLAGIDILSEVDVPQEIEQKFKSGFMGKDSSYKVSVGKALQALKDDKLDAEDEKSLVQHVEDDDQTKSAVSNLIKKSKGEDTEDKGATADSSKSGSEAGSSGEDYKEYEGVFKEIRGKITDESITDDDIKKVIKFIDVKDAKDAPVSIA